jgi:hypothetical protein
MTAERWQQIEKLYHFALEHEPRQREVFLGALVLGTKLFAVIRVAAHKDQAERTFE